MHVGGWVQGLEKGVEVFLLFLEVLFKCCVNFSSTAN